MKEDTRRLLGKASRAVRAAEILLRETDAEFSAGRAYYAMLYVAEALLNEKGFTFRSHGGVHAGFGEHFAKTSLVDPKFHRWLLDAFDKRLAGDYGVEAALTREDAGALIKQAREFLVEAYRFLGEP